VTTRLTFDPTDEIWPVWSPEGTRVAYASNRDGSFRCYLKAASGVGTEDSLAYSGGYQGPTDWSRDGRTLLSTALGAKGWDLWVQPAEERATPTVFLQTPFNERSGRLSPDGRWLAYQSDESGRREIYVLAFPGPGGKWQVSTGGGTKPHWRADGNEIYYRTLEQTIMAVPVSAGASFEPGTPRPLFKAVLNEGGYSGTRWVPSADGQRFLLNSPLDDRSRARFIVVTDWTAELRTGKRR